MRTMNLDPFWRTSIGFDRLFDLMDESLRFEPEDHYPPCNIVRTGENTYRISLAVAGCVNRLNRPPESGHSVVQPRCPSRDHKPTSVVSFELSHAAYAGFPCVSVRQ